MSIQAPFSSYTEVVRPDWADRHGHLSVGRYAYLFEEAARAFFRSLDISQAYRERTNHAYFALEEHVAYEREAFIGDNLTFTSQFIAWTPKRLICLHAMHNRTRGSRSAFAEVIYAHISLRDHRSVPLSAEQQARLRPVLDTHLRLPRPLKSGRSIVPIASG